MGALYGAAVVALFASFTLVSRLGLSTSLAPWDLALLRFGIGGMVMLPVLVRHGFAGVRLRDGLSLAFCGGLGFALCAYAGFAWAPATHGAVLLHGTLPLTTHVLTRTTSGAPLRSNTRGLPMIALGVMAMASESALRSTALQLAGDCALLMASFSWSAYGLLARKIGWSPAHSASIVAVLSMCAYVPVFVLVSPLSGFGAAAWREIALQVVFQGVLIGAVSIFVYSKSVAVLGAARTASLSAAVPCVTTLGASLLLRETPSLISLVGVALVTAGMLVSLQCNNAARSGRCLERS